MGLSPKAAVGIGIGLVLLGALGLTLTPDAEYRTEVSPADESQIRDGERVYAYENLSEIGQSVFRQARHSADGGAIRIGAGGRAPEFDYYDDESSKAYIRYDGRYYSVATYRRGCSAPLCVFPAFASVLLAGAGVVLLAVPPVRFVRQR
ncbi:hypothetical protein [Halomicrobium salinisoli]|uniref:hypothetical protein n=1 Tax=Halomicrobium salinisoli TaxID=2878391 RepID=UPI001CF039B8|nr:hypothetical protein [Halomicrobium salinisoli]